MRLVCALLFLLVMTASGPARAETDWFASLYTNEGVELRADERVFALYALLNGMGYDEAPLVRTLPVPARDMHLVRLKVRSAVKLDPGDEERLSTYFNAHQRPAEAYGRYVLALKGPAAFERSAGAPAELKGFESLLADGYAHLKLADLFAAVQDDYRAALKGYHGVVDAPVLAVRRLLKMKEDDPPRVVLVVNLLDGQGHSYSTVQGDELWVVVGPSKAPDLFAVAHEVARARLEPLVGPKAGDAESAAFCTDVLSRAVAAQALALPDAEIDRRAPEGFPGLRDLARQVDAFAKADKPLDGFVGEVVPAILKDSGRKPAKGK